MQQNELFHEDIFEALRTDIMALGGMKKVGHMLWPDKAPSKAGENLSSCLNESRPEKLDPNQVLFIKREAKQVGSFATQYFESDEIGMTRPTPIEPEDEKAQLEREFIEAQKNLTRMLGRIEKLSEPSLKAVGK